jgi:hypothetical protein
MMPLPVLIRRFAVPVIAVYLLHWGAWALVGEGTQVIMSLLTGALTWFAGTFPVGFPEVERAIWSGKFLALEAAWYGIAPILAGVLTASFVWWSKNRRSHNTLAR